MSTLEKTQTIYDRIAKDLNGRASRKVANNTYLQRRDADTIALRYHATDVVTYYADGRVVLDTGGWRTSTTKLRFNESYSRLPVRIWANRGVWYVSTYYSHQCANEKRVTCSNCKHSWCESCDPAPFALCHWCHGRGYSIASITDEYAFDDGLTLWPDENGVYHVDESTVGEDPKKTIKLRRKVQKYAADYIAALRAGKVGKPSAGDCLYCAMRTVDGNVPLGETFKDKDHIERHIAERYFVPSLIVRATEVMPCSQAMKWVIGETWEAAKDQTQKTFEKIDPYWSKQDFIWQSLSKMLGRYLLRQLGEVS